MTDNYTQTNPHTTLYKTLYRSRDDKMIAGVCSGLGERFGFDPNILRIALAVSTLFGGTGIIAYLIAWVVLPERVPASQTDAPTATRPSPKAAA